MSNAVKRRVRRVVRSGADRGIDHRADFKHCPSCDHAMENENWDKTGVTLVLEPACYKAGCVVVVSECPQCFDLSWVHNRMDGFKWNEAWPKEWVEAVKKQDAAVKLNSLRQWGNALCHSCRHLTKGTVEYHAWRTCIIGIGPVRTECDKYKAVAK